ncbi:MAG: alpha/beta hydrolase [Pseudonocardiales bacterium]
MVSVGDIRTWRPAELDDAFDELSARRDALIGLDDELAAARAPAGWIGAAAATAHDALSERARRIVAGISAVPRAEDVDADFAAVLHRAARGEIDDGTGSALAQAAATGAGSGGLSTAGPPENGTPGDNAGWWAALSDEERRALIDSDPGALGNLDGLPAAVRDEANRARIDAERAALEAERNRLQADLDDNWFGGTFTNADAALDHVNTKLAALNRIEETLDQPGERQLLLLDLSGERAEAAVAVGNVDTADHVAVFTPGLGSTVDGSLERYYDNMDRLRRQAQHESERYGMEDRWRRSRRSATKPRSLGWRASTRSIRTQCSTTTQRALMGPSWRSSTGASTHPGPAPHRPGPLLRIDHHRVRAAGTDRDG